MHDDLVPWTCCAHKGTICTVHTSSAQPGAQLQLVATRTVVLLEHTHNAADRTEGQHALPAPRASHWAAATQGDTAGGWSGCGAVPGEGGRNGDGTRVGRGAKAELWPPRAEAARAHVQHQEQRRRDDGVIKHAWLGRAAGRCCACLCGGGSVRAAKCCHEVRCSRRDARTRTRTRAPRRQVPTACARSPTHT